MDVVLGAGGWPGVMLHEAVGHGLEGDFNRKQTSAFAGLMGQQVAAKGVTVVDDGTMASRRGSLSIDDEGTPTSRTVLIEDGILVGYMQDRQNARLMKMKATGNGRRESHGHVPMPRMTNTYMLAGSALMTRGNRLRLGEERHLCRRISGGGQVDITSGKYVFQCTEAYKIENGKLGAPLKGAMLIGNGPTDLHRITMIGNDLALDTGIGTCGKNGQGVPVGVGQPTLRMERITVGRNRRMRQVENNDSIKDDTDRPAATMLVRWPARPARRRSCFLVVFVAKGALAEPFYVPSGSMEPTLLIGDALLASKYRLWLQRRPQAADPDQPAPRPAACSARYAETRRCRGVPAGPAIARRPYKVKARGRPARRPYPDAARAGLFINDRRRGDTEA